MKMTKTGAGRNGEKERVSAKEIAIVSRSFTDAQGGSVVEALRSTGLEVSEGEFAAIAGPSGYGESTLLNMLGGFSSPTPGKPVPGPDIQRGMVFRDRAFFPG